MSITEPGPLWLNRQVIDPVAIYLVVVVSWCPQGVLPSKKVETCCIAPFDAGLNVASATLSELTKLASRVVWQGTA
jgi:hypothetical protein